MVEFLPPQYRNPDTETNEEMEVYLVDEDTKEETNHVKFVYHSVKGNTTIGAGSSLSGVTALWSYSKTHLS